MPIHMGAKNDMTDSVIIESKVEWGLYNQIKIPLHVL